MKKDFTLRQKQNGNERDYFAEADRKAQAAEERLRKEAEQKKQEAFATSNPQQPQQTQQTQPAPGFGSLGTPNTGSAPTGPSNIFATPQQSVPLFSPPTFGAQSLGGAPAFGGSPSPATPGLFGAQPANQFGMNAFGGQTAFGGGAQTTSGSKSKSKSKRGK